jgi:hypothetical protein
VAGDEFPAHAGDLPRAARAADLAGDDLGIERLRLSRWTMRAALAVSTIGRKCMEPMPIL